MVLLKLFFLVLIGMPAGLHAQLLVSDTFDGAAGTVPDAAKFDWGGDVAQNGSGQVSIQTWAAHSSWMRSKTNATLSVGATLVLQMRAYAYAEAPGTVYGDYQPRGLRVGSDANNVMEFFSDSRTSVGMRVRNAGSESSTTYSLPAGVDSMHDYQISVTTTSAVF